MEFLEGWELNFKKPSMVGVWIFSGTTQFGHYNLRSGLFRSKIGKGQGVGVRRNITFLPQPLWSFPFDMLLVM